MRVRPKQHAEPRRTLIPRRREAAPARERPADEPEVEPTREHLEKERARASGGPEDNALYRCECGFAFEAAVSTTVACPHCGTGQAW